MIARGLGGEHVARERERARRIDGERWPAPVLRVISRIHRASIAFAAAAPGFASAATGRASRSW